MIARLQALRSSGVAVASKAQAANESDFLHNDENIRRGGGESACFILNGVFKMISTMALGRIEMRARRATMKEAVAKTGTLAL